MSLRSSHIRKYGVAAEMAVVVCIVGSLCLLPGCSGFDLRKRIPWGEGKNGEFPPPLKAATFWTEAIMNRSDAPGLRGFGGRILFYGKDPNTPIKVKGSLVVYAFDETSRDPTNVVPDRKFVFTAEQLEQHYSKGDLGHSYSIWLPWDEVNGPSKEISLIARFSPEKGGLILSEQTKHRLTGMPQSPAPSQTPATSLPADIPRPLPDIARASAYPIQQASFMEPTKPTSPVSVTTAPTNSQVNATTTAPNGMTTDEIAEMARQMTTTTIRYHQPPRARWTVPDSQGTSAPANAQIPQNSWQPSNVPPAGFNVPPTSMPAAQMQPVQQYMPQQAVAAPGAIPSANYATPAQVYAAPTTATAAPAIQPPVPAGVQPQVYSQPIPPATHSAPERLRPLGAPIARLERGHAPWQPRRAEPPFSHPFQP